MLQQIVDCESLENSKENAYYVYFSKIASFQCRRLQLYYKQTLPHILYGILSEN